MGFEDLLKDATKEDLKKELRKSQKFTTDTLIVEMRKMGQCDEKKEVIMRGVLAKYEDEIVDAAFDFYTENELRTILAFQKSDFYKRMIEFEAAVQPLKTSMMADAITAAMDLPEEDE